MNCPICNQSMKKVGWHITNNGRKDKTDYKEYDSTTYQCETDDAWLVTDLPKPN